MLSERGIDAKHFLCIETPPPLRTDGCFALATDDIVHVTLQGPLHSHRRVSDIDKALVDHGIERNVEKDVTAATNGTALGTDLVDGAYFAPAIKKVGNSACRRHLHPETTFVVSSSNAHTLLGHYTWFFLLARSFFVFECVLQLCAPAK